MINREYVCIGIIKKPVGIKGQVKIIPYTESPESFSFYQNLFFENHEQIKLKSLQINEKGEIVCYINGFNNRTDVESLRLKKIFTNKSDLPKLDSQEYYFDDLMDSEVIDQKGNQLGNVVAVLNFGAGVFLEISLKDSKKIGTISFNKDSIIEVNLEQNLIKINENFLLS